MPIAYLHFYYFLAALIAHSEMMSAMFLYRCEAVFIATRSADRNATRSSARIIGATESSGIARTI